jgi:hypothetical protein
MSGSFRKIDYRLRPAKTIERRMMAESFLRLRPFGSVESYRYVGMGSVYFADFSLFHSVCGFQVMVSIEDVEDPVIKRRFEFNAPHGHIVLQFGHTNVELPRLAWDLRTVAWLDYDGPLTKHVLIDARYLSAKLVSGSVLVISVNANLEDEETGEADRLLVFKKRLADEQPLPDWVTKAGAIKPAEVTKLFRDVLQQAVSDALNDRNSGRPAGQKYVAEQILLFKYQDSAPMFTIGWVFFDEGQRPSFDQCAFASLPYSRFGDAPFTIDVPLITTAEVREINRCSSIPGGRSEADLPIPPSEITKYRIVKRYWPSVSPAEMT